MQRAAQRAIVQLPSVIQRAVCVVLAPGQDFRLSLRNALKACAEQVMRGQFTTLKQTSRGAGSEASEFVAGKGHGAVQKV
jgi:hypothetical protein